MARIRNLASDKRLSWGSFWRSCVVMLMDAICIFLSYFIALLARFEFRMEDIPSYFLEHFRQAIPIIILVSLVVFFLNSLYNSIWHFVGIREIRRLIAAHCILSFFGGMLVIANRSFLPLSFYCIGLTLSFLSTSAVHFSCRLFSELKRDVTQKLVRENIENIMIIGAGAAGKALIGEITASQHIHGKVVCLIDDNPAKRHQLLEGVPIVGNRTDIPEMVQEYSISKIIYAIPTSSPETKRDILEICSTTKCKIQSLPGIYQLVNGEVSVSNLRNVDVQDLLGRDPVRVNMDEISAVIKDKTVLVTGGGGSIGSELCRQIAKRSPKKLIVFDIYENNAYDIQFELLRAFPGLDLTVLIGSVRNPSRVEWVMDTYRPELVFHAAAHKHVPLMEESPNEAIKNNVFGTYNVASLSARYGVKKFILISTDKAVNPTNIMGASKRLCEMVIQMMNRRTDTEFAAVRFGNVLGSNGSVIPLFKKQIAAGGPVTVTHKDITRFFMTIPEAVSLVLQAGCYAKGGEIFVLDMGKPVRIDDMARNLIRLSGYEPDVDIKIVYTGLRPGEKLYEELLMEEEGLRETANKLIHIGRPIEMDDETFLRQLDTLKKACEEESADIKAIVAGIVPTYHPEQEPALP